MPAERHPQHGGHDPEHGRRHIGQRPPRRRRQRRGRIGPERGGALAGEERAVAPALPARIPPRHELPGAVELRHHHRPRPSPVALEGEIGQHDGGEQDGDQQKHRRASRNQHRPVRPHQLSHDGNQRRQRQRPGDPHRGIAREGGKPVLLQRKRCARGIVEQCRQLQVEFGKNPEQQSDDERQAQRDNKSGPVHGAGFSRGGWG